MLSRRRQPRHRSLARIAFKSPIDLADCLARIIEGRAARPTSPSPAKPGTVGPFRVVGVKNTMGIDQDWRATAGFPDVVMNLALQSREAWELGNAGHVCEVQVGSL